ncbi:aldo/keto reductase [Catelliglobosispora koreensis]|uniref:aldo/keto reductase n=1 Tax=Catelliglobosispora koreensis TaxID=129052 RepID=UPI0003631DF1
MVQRHGNLRDMYTNLGRTGLRVSRICLGTMNFGSYTGEDAAEGIMDRALDHGINFFDTANSYPSPGGKGATEQIIGRWFGRGGGRREKVVLATKAYSALDSTAPAWPNDRGLSARNIIASCDSALRRLNTDWIDLFQMHHIDRSTPWEEIWQAMDLLISQGKIRYVGSSNFAGWHLAAAQEEAIRRNLLGLVSEQPIYNMITRLPELEVIPAAVHYGIAVIPWSPLQRGLLGGILQKIELHGSARDFIQEDLKRHLEAIRGYEKLCAEAGIAPAAVAIAWLLSRPGVTAPIVGARVSEHLDQAIQALSVELTPDVLARIDELFPPPGQGRPAPEAWAW